MEQLKWVSNPGETEEELLEKHKERYGVSVALYSDTLCNAKILALLLGK
jgi:hypothetical protein